MRRRRLSSVCPLKQMPIHIAMSNLKAHAAKISGRKRKGTLPVQIGSDTSDSGSDDNVSKSIISCRNTSPLSPTKNFNFGDCKHVIININEQIPLQNINQANANTKESDIQQPSTSRGNQENNNNFNNRHLQDTLVSTNQNTNNKQLHSNGNRSSPTTYPSKKEKKMPDKKSFVLFKTLIETICKDAKARSLLPDDVRVLEKILKLSENAQIMFFKLFTRKRKWYNIYKLSDLAKLLFDDKDVSDAYKMLKKNGFVETDSSIDDVRVLLDDMNRSDVANICKRFKVNSTTKKGDMIGYLLRKLNEPTLDGRPMVDNLKHQIKREMGASVKLKEDVWESLSRAYFFATFHNKNFREIQQFLYSLAYLNVQFPEYDKEMFHVFDTLQEFLDYDKSRCELESIINTTNSGNQLEIGNRAFSNLKIILEDNVTNRKQQRHLKRYTACYMYVKILIHASEKLHKYIDEERKVEEWLHYIIDNAIDYCHGMYSHCYVTLIKIHMKSDPKKALKLFMEVFTEKQKFLNEIEIHELAKYGEKLKNRKQRLCKKDRDDIVDLLPRKIEDFPETRIDAHSHEKCTKGNKRKYKHVASDGSIAVVTVEHTALNHYRTNCGFTDGLHCEGEVVKALFTVFFYDIIYKPTKHVAHTFGMDWQMAPLDINTRYFYENRRDIIEQRLEEIETSWSDATVLKFATDIWEKHSHERTVYFEVNNTIKDVDMLETLILCVGRVVLAKIFRRLVKDMKAYSSGLPDLLLWHKENKKCKFVEVKSENDRLSLKQRLWLHNLKEFGAEIEVCYVTSIIGNKGNNRDDD